MPMLVDASAWIAATVAGVLPLSITRRFHRLPMRAAALPSALLTLAIGFYAGLAGFLHFGGRVTSAENSWMLHQLNRPSAHVNPYAVAVVPYGTSIFVPFGFLLTPLGLASVYLAVSGAIRAISAGFGDPRGDFLLSAAWSICSGTAARVRDRSSGRARERREGPDAPDVLRTGAWCGIDADCVVLAARQKPEWTEGAIVMTDDEWYRLGVPFDMDTPSGLRAAYPLKRISTMEVVRRGIRYTLPVQRKKPAKP